MIKSGLTSRETSAFVVRKYIALKLPACSRQICCVVALLRVANWLRIIAFFEKLLLHQQIYCVRRICCVSGKIVAPTRFVAFREKLSRRRDLLRFGKKIIAPTRFVAFRKKLLRRRDLLRFGEKIVNNLCAISFFQNATNPEGAMIFFKMQQIRRAQ